MSDIFVGRQPIYNNKLNVYGYELLFRSGAGNAATFEQLGAEGATSCTIINAFVDMGLDRLVADRYAFINLTESFFVNREALPIPPKQVVLEVLEDIPISEHFIKAVQLLKEKGFVIALDDYIYNPSHKPLVAIADIIKIDIMQLSREELTEHVNILNKFPAKLLAEKIENLDEFELCRQLGFDYYQGYFLSKPRVVKTQSLASNRLAVLNLLAILQNPESDVEEIEEAMGFDVSISYKILKLINSAVFNFSSKIESIRQAIVVLGRKQLTSWVSMMALSSLDNRPTEMVHLTMVRAKMCEILAEKAQLSPLETYFTVGLFSALDILMERNLPNLLEKLPLSQELLDALLNYRGSLGEALQCVLAYEISDVQNVKFKNLTQEDIRIANIEAVSWANMVVEIN